MNDYELAILEFTNQDVTINDVKQNLPNTPFYFTTKESCKWAIFATYLYKEKKINEKYFKNKLDFFINQNRKILCKDNSGFDLFKELSIEFNLDIKIIDSIHETAYNSLLQKNLITNPTKLEVLGISFFVLGIRPFDFVKKTKKGLLIYNKISSLFWTMDEKSTSKEIEFDFNLFHYLKMLKSTLKSAFQTLISESQK